jgi:two-component system OmpR family sensor kinase
MGIALFAIRYHTASACQDPRGRALGIVEVATTYPTVQAVLRRLRMVLIFAVLAVFAAGLLIGGPVTAGALRPLARMTQTARRIASGDLSQRVDLPHTDDEIGQLAQTFDDMVARIQAAFGAQAASEGRMRQFVADASHELRTPLTSIRGYLDVLLRGAAADDPAEARRVLLAARSEAERMTGLVGDLLTLARLDAGPTLRREPVDLWALAGAAVDQARILAGEREVSLASDQGGAPRVVGDPDRLKQVLLILLDNALKYGRPAPEGWVRVRVGRTERGGVISVMDNGQGIAPEDVEHIFDRFYRGERAARQRRMSGIHDGMRGGVGSGGHGGSPTWAGAGGSGGVGGSGSAPGRTPSGSGLGLAIAEAIVRAHGGTLSVESRLGVGTTFTMVLPQA